MKRFVPLVGALSQIALLAFSTPAHGAVWERLHAFAGLGVSDDPDDDDRTAVYSLAAGYELHQHVSLGLELRKLDSTQVSRGLTPNIYGKVALFPSRVFNPYARVAFGRFDMGGAGHPSFYLAAGLELGHRNFGVYFELGDRMVEGNDVLSLVGGLSVHGG